MTPPSLSNLVVRWAEAFEQGQDLPAEQLCPDHPEWIDELTRRIDALRRMRQRPGPAAVPAPVEAETAPGPPPTVVPPTLPSAVEESHLPVEADEEGMHIPGYRIEGVLGKGGMGVVYLARQENLGRLVALKMIRTGPWTTPEHRERLLREARLAARLDHGGIVAIHAIGEEQGQPFIALEYEAGGSLEKRLDGRPWPIDKAVRLVEQLARAVHHAHLHGIVHRDLKPANVLLTADDAPRVTDFGLARHREDCGGTRSGVIMGTPRYMAPEQAMGKVRAIGPATDVHALGVILYELLTGKPAFSGGNMLELLQCVRDRDPAPPRQLRRDLPGGLEAICLRCLAKDPAGRYPDAESLANDLHRFLAIGPTTAGRPRRTRWLPLAVLAGCCALLLSAAPVLWWFAQPPQGEPGKRPGSKLIVGDNNSPPAENPTSPVATLDLTQSLELGVVRAAPHIVGYLKKKLGKGPLNVGVLKFLVRKGKGSLSDNVGSLNLDLARRLELALIHAVAIDDPMNVIQNASAVAAKLKGANHLTAAGRVRLFEGQYQPAWGRQNITVSADAFLTGEVQWSSDLQDMTVTICCFDNQNKKPSDLTEVVKLKARAGANVLAQGGAPFLLRGSDGEETAARSAARVQAGEEPHPLAPEAKPWVKLEIRYDNTPVPLEFTRGLVQARVPEPREGQKVTFVLQQTGADGAEMFALVLKVNGESTISRERASDLVCRKWILQRGKRLLINGFYETVNGKTPGKITLFPFKAASRRESTGEEMDYGGDLGTISLVVYRQQGKVIPPLAFEASKKEQELALLLSRGVYPTELPESRGALWKQFEDQIRKWSTRSVNKPGGEKARFVEDPTPIQATRIVYDRSVRRDEPAQADRDYAVTTIENGTEGVLAYRWRWTGQEKWTEVKLAQGAKQVHFLALTPGQQALPLLETEIMGRGTGKLKPSKWTGKGEPTAENGEAYRIRPRKK